MYVSPWMQSVLLPQSWLVAGVACKPLSLWHAYILRTSGNPLVHGGAISEDAIAEVLMYCSGGIEHGRRLYQMPHYRNRCRKRIARKMKRAGYKFAASAVREYVSECIRVPTHEYVTASTKDGDVSKPINAPEEFVLAEYLLSVGVCKTLDDALDYQYSAACCLLDAGRNARGEDSSLVTEDKERKIDERIEKAGAAA
jgi:hypothetical protein